MHGISGGGIATHAHRGGGARLHVEGGGGGDEAGAAEDGGRGERVRTSRGRGGGATSEAGDGAAEGATDGARKVRGGGGDEDRGRRVGHAHGGRAAHAHGGRGPRGADGADEAEGTEGGGGRTDGCDGAGGSAGEEGVAGADAGVTALTDPALLAQASGTTGIAPTALTDPPAAAATDPAALALTTPAAAPQASGTAAALIQQAAAGLGGSDIAQQVLSALQQSGAPIDVISDSAFASKYGRASGVFDPATNRISLPESVAADPSRLQLILLHEGVHYLQENVPGGVEALGGAAGQALQGAGAVRTTTPGSKGDLQHDEAQAYLLEALVANQVGLQDRGLGVGSSGRALGYEQTLARVQATPEYA